MPVVSVAVVGIGNCACSIVEGVALHRSRDLPGDLSGTGSVAIGDYEVADIRFVAAFDIAMAKVGKDLAAAIRSEPNDTFKIATVPPIGVIVQRGPTLDGISRTCSSIIEESNTEPVDVVAALRESKADVVVSYLPVGSDTATYFYASAALDAGCGFINCMPTAVASNPEWSNRFKDAGLPLIGDDVKSQIGATILHRTLLRLFRDRGVSTTSGYQLNMGGNMDFRNMDEPERGAAKEISKMNALESLTSENLNNTPNSASVTFMPGLGDRKVAYIRLEGTSFGGAPVSLEVRLDVWDSSNSAGVVTDAIRYSKVALEAGIGGPLEAACAYFMKSPPVQMEEGEAFQELRMY